MVRSIRLAVAVGFLAALVLGTGTVLAGSDGHGSGGHDRRHAKEVLETRLVGLAQPGQILVGVTGAGRPWTLKKGEAKLYADGRIDLNVRGLVLGPGGANEGINPVTTGRAIVSCNGGVLPTDKVMSDPVPFSVPDGNARVKTKLALPSPCLAPVIFFASATGSWFAVSG